MIRYHNPADIPVPPDGGYRFAVEGEATGRMTHVWIPNHGWQEKYDPYDDRPVHPHITYATNRPYWTDGTFLSMEDPVLFLNIANSMKPNETPPVPAEAIAHGAPVPPPTDAADATLTARAAMYGTFAQNSKVAQGLKAILAGAIVEREDALPDDLTESLDMICSKLARIVNGSPEAWHDSLLDIEGFARLPRERMEGNPR